MSSGSVVQASAVNAMASDRKSGRMTADFTGVINLLRYRDGVDFADDVAGVDQVFSEAEGLGVDTHD